MGQLARRGRGDNAAEQDHRAGQGLWLESCTRCGCPLTILAAARPTDPLCPKCSAAGPTADTAEATTDRPARPTRRTRPPGRAEGG